jgi:AcrR family transcriptional regulator
MLNGRPVDTRQRILETTAEMFRRYGYTGTGLKQIVTDANTAFGSLYHFFPNGKEELGDAVIRRSGQMYQELVEAVWDGAPNVVRGVQDVFDGAAAVLRETDYADACPIATVALEVASTNEILRQATADVFESWITSGTDRFVAAGVPSRRARDLAILVIELLEGAFLLCRAMRTTRPMDTAGAAAVAAVRAALPTSPRRKRTTTSARR